MYNVFLYNVLLYYPMQLLTIGLHKITVLSRRCSGHYWLTDDMKNDMIDEFPADMLLSVVVNGASRIQYLAHKNSS